MASQYGRYGYIAHHRVVEAAKPFQMEEIVAQCTICHCGIDLSADMGKLAFSFSRNGLKNLALAVCEVMSDAKRRHSSAQTKSHIHRPNAASYVSNCLTSLITT